MGDPRGRSLGGILWGSLLSEKRMNSISERKKVFVKDGKARFKINELIYIFSGKVS